MDRSATAIETRNRSPVLIALLAAFLVAAASVPCRCQPTTPSSEQKTLLFLAEENDPPLNYAENGVVKGRDVDFAVALGKAMERNVRVELTSWDKASQAIEEGKADGFLTVADSELRKQVFDISEPVFRNSFGIFVRTGEVRIHDVDDLNGRKVGVIGLGSFSRQFFSGRHEITLVTCSNYVDAFGRLASGQIDAVATQTWLGAYWVQQQPGRNFTLAGEFADQPVGVGVRKGNSDLLRQINVAIARLKSDGTIVRIEEKWRPQEILFLSRQRVERTVYWSVGAFLAVLLVAMALWIATLRRQGKRLRLLAHALHSANDCIAIADPSDRILLVNDAFRRTYEYEDREIIGRQASVLRAENDNPNLGDEILSSTKKGGWRGELWNRSKNGRVFPISLVASPLSDDRGHLVATVGVARDITMEHENADALRSSQEKFAKLFQASPDCIVLAELRGVVLEVNERFEEITGYSRSQILGHTAADLKLLLDPSLLGRLADILEGGGTVREVEYQLRCKSGNVATILMSADLIEIGGTRCVLSVHRDITKRKQLETQLQQIHKMEAIGRLAAGIAHDFNNLLTVISGNCEMEMQGLQPGDRFASAFAEIQSAASRAAELTQQLLAFSRQQPIVPRVLDLNQVLAELQNMLRRLIGEHISLHFLPGARLDTVRIGIGHLQQIALNLVVNARDAMPAGGTLRLETMNAHVPQPMVEHPEMPIGDYVVFAVSDTGSGMDAATQARLFEPFFTTKELGQGTGLGLATVYGIVKQNNGYIWVHSELGVGTTFRIYFPRANEALTAVRAEPIPATPKQGNATVFLAEDEDALRSMLSKHLTSLGYQVIAVANGAQALEKWGGLGQEPALLVTDVRMPGMSGRELAETLLARQPALKVLYISGYADEAVLQECAFPSGSSFLQKPFGLHVFAKKVQELLAID